MPAHRTRLPMALLTSSDRIVIASAGAQICAPATEAADRPDHRVVKEVSAPVLLISYQQYCKA